MRPTLLAPALASLLACVGSGAPDGTDAPSNGASGGGGASGGAGAP